MYRLINTKIWDDNYIVKLKSDEKLLFVYLLTNSLTNVCGIYEISFRRIWFDLLLSEERIKEILKQFETDDKIYFIEGWIYIKNFQKHQVYNENMKKGVERCVLNVPSEILAIIKEKDKGFGMVQKGSEGVEKLKPKLNLTKLKLNREEEQNNYDFFKNYSISKGFFDRDLKLEWEKIQNWFEAGGHKPKTWKNFYLNWLKKVPIDPVLMEKRIGDKKQKQLEEQMALAEKEKALPEEAQKRLAEMKQGLINKMKI